MPADRPAPLWGLVLAGGRSTRMGRDKSLIDYHGQPQREHLARLLRPYCEAVYWSLNAEQAAAVVNLDQPIIVDNQPDAGPLGGIVSAMRHAPTVAWLVVACDLPNLTSETVAVLVAGRRPERVATAFWDADRSGPEPLVSIWEPGSLASLITVLVTGPRSPRQWLRENKAHLLDPSNPDDLLNVNTPTDWPTPTSA